MKTRNALTIGLLLTSIATSCRCGDEHPGWQLYEDVSLREDVANVEDLTVVEDFGVDLPAETDAGWQPEEVVEDVPIDHALNERTSLAVDDDGTLFLGYHRCVDENCGEVDLVVARRARGASRFTHETVKRQRGTFGIAVANPEEVVAAFLDPTDNTFKVSRRLGPNEWEFRALGVRRTGVSDGLDLAPDADRMFVTFANERGDPVSLFVLAQEQWRALASLDIGEASAAYERGLASDNQGNLYLTHRRGPDPSPWGVARYSLAAGEWTDRIYYEQTPRPRPSSMLVTDSRRICIAGDVDFRWLTITCGDMTNLERDRWQLDEEVALGAGGYSSMLEGTDGSLYVAYPSQDNTLLRLAEKPADSDVWSAQTVIERNAFGVSTIIDDADLLVISYYTCEGGRCSLQIVSQRQ